MKANEIYQHLLDSAIEKWEVTCDGWIAGDPNKSVSKVATCFKLTAELIAKAAAEGVDMIITHEPTFARGDLRENATLVDLKKWELLDKSGITVYRFHDHAHNSAPDYIHAGFMQALGVQVFHKYPNESLGVCRYDVADNFTVASLAKRIEERLGVDFVRVVGDENVVVKTLCLGLGAVGFDQIYKLFDPGCDVFITGEVGEVCDCEYVRDACYFGEKKAIILLGHYSSEYAGMRFLAEKMNQNLISTVFLAGGEVYRRV